MTIEAILKAYSAIPFKPFDIHLADGRTIGVPHRDFISSSPLGRTITVLQPNGTRNVIDLLLVTDLEFKPPLSSIPKRRKTGS